MKIKKNDNVIVIAGKDKGKKGKILRTFPVLDKILVEGINLRTRRVRARRSNQKGEVAETALPVHVSNVMLWCGSCSKGSRTKTLVVKGKKVRSCVKCSKEI